MAITHATGKLSPFHSSQSDGI